MVQTTDWAARLQQPDDKPTTDWAARLAGQSDPDPIPEMRAQGPNIPMVEVNPVPSGENPIVRAQAEFLSDNPAELQRWAQQRYGPNATIRRGSDINPDQFRPGTPEGESTYLSRDYGQPYELFDPTQGMAEQRAGGGVGGMAARAAEFGAEVVEQAPSFAVEGAIEAGLLFADRLVPGSGRIAAAARAAPRAMRLARGTAMAGAAAGAVAGSNALQQIVQDYSGTQLQTRDEQTQQAIQESLEAGALSAFFTGADVVGRRAVDVALGHMSPQGRDALDAAREFNRMAREGELQAGDVSRISAPLAGFSSQNPTTRTLFAYLARLSPEINTYQRNMREQVRKVADSFAAQDENFRSQQVELVQSLSDFGQRIESRIYGKLGMDDTEELGIEALGFLGAYKEESRRAVDEAYGRAYTLMQRDFGDRQVQYDWGPVEAALREAREERTMRFQRRNPQTGEVETELVRRQVGDTSAWNNFERIEGMVDGVLRGERQAPPETVLAMIEEINDELADAPIQDRGRRALVRLKSALNQTLDSIPEQNEGIGVDALRALRNAQAMHADRLQTLNNVGVAAILSAGDTADYYRAASQLYGSENLSGLRRVRDALTGEGGMQGSANGIEHWNRLRQAYGLYAVRQAGEPGRAYDAWRGLNADVKNTLFPDEAERQAFGRSLRDMDALHNNAGFQRIATLGEQSDRFVRNLVDQGVATPDSRSVQIVRQALEEADQAGATGPRKAFNAGVWQYLMDNSLSRTRDGQLYMDSRAFANSAERLRSSGVLDALNEEQLAQIRRFESILPASDFEMAGSGAGLAAAQTAAALVDPNTAAGAALDLATLRLVSAGLVASNPALASMMGASRDSVRTNVPTAISRMTQYYMIDESQNTPDEWRRFERALREANGVATGEAAFSGSRGLMDTLMRGRPRPMETEA